MTTQKQLLTLDDYHEFIDRPENRDRIFELIEGELVEKMPSFKPSRIAANLIFLLKLFLRDHPLGFVTAPDGGYIMTGRKRKGNVFIPDVGYISRARLRGDPAREAPVPPDLAIEVVSPTDDLDKVRDKARKYLEFGARLVWVIFPETQTVEVYAPGREVEVVGADGALSGGEVLPGFTLAVKDVFAE